MHEANLGEGSVRLNPYPTLPTPETRPEVQHLRRAKLKHNRRMV